MRRAPTDAHLAFGRLVDEHLVPALSAHGFRRTGTTFHRAAGANWEVLNVEKYPGSTRREVAFTINLAVGWAALRTGKQTWPDGQRPAHELCHFRDRIGAVSAGEERWWNLTRRTNLTKLSANVMSVLEESGLPWLEGRSSLAEAEALLTSPDVLGGLPAHQLYPLARVARLLGDDVLVARADEALAEHGYGPPA